MKRVNFRKVFLFIFLLSISLGFSKTFSSNSPSLFNYDLSLGSRGKDVLQLQQVLNSDLDTVVAVSGAGSNGNETEYFGRLTQLAVIKFQKKYSISPAVGYVGPLTRNSLNRLFGPRYSLGLPSDTYVDLRISTFGEETSVTPGSSISLYWVSQNVTDCFSGNMARPVYGSETITNITKSVSIQISCNSSKGVVSDNVVVKVPNPNATFEFLALVDFSLNPIITNTTNAGMNVLNTDSNSNIGTNNYIYNDTNTSTTTATSTATTTIFSLTHLVDIKQNGLDNWSGRALKGSSLIFAVNIFKNNNDFCIASSTPDVSGWTGNRISTDTVFIGVASSSVLEIICTNSDTGERYKDIATITRLEDVYEIPDTNTDGPSVNREGQLCSSFTKPSSIDTTETKELKTCTLPASWSRNSCRNYGGDLSTPGEFYGLVDCGSSDAATSFRYNLRAHFEWDLWRQVGYGRPNIVNIQVYSDGTAVWWVSSN